MQVIDQREIPLEHPPSLLEHGWRSRLWESVSMSNPNEDSKNGEEDESLNLLSGVGGVLWQV